MATVKVSKAIKQMATSGVDLATPDLEKSILTYSKPRRCADLVNLVNADL